MNWTRRLLVLLAISIGLNLLLAGLWIGARWSEPRHGPGLKFGGVRDGREGRFPPAFSQAIEGRRDDLAARRQAVAEARLTARSILEREPLDRAALENALERLRRETEGSQQVVHQALIDAAARAPKESRRELGRVLSQRHRMGRGDGPITGPRPDPSED
jgi:uncharacterized membrane protein